MKRKYHWDIALPPEKFVDILYKSITNGYQIWGKKKKIVIRHPRYIFGGTTPVNFQVSFIAKLEPSKCNTILNGKFGLPRLFYMIFFGLYFLISISLVFFSDFDPDNMVSAFLNCFLLALFELIVFRILVFTSIKVFKKENQDVINLLDSIQAEYGQHNSRV